MVEDEFNSSKYENNVIDFHQLIIKNHPLVFCRYITMPDNQSLPELDRQILREAQDMVWSDIR